MYPIRKPILVIEDVDAKFHDVMECVFDQIGIGAPHRRAKNLNQAEDEVMLGGWSLIILDLSMDISATGSMDLSSGHATLGGLDVLERMALLKIQLPTILVTGFDSFQDPDRFDNSIMNLEDVNAMAKGWLGQCYFGCVRYGSETWRDQLNKAIKAWSEI